MKCTKADTEDLKATQMFLNVCAEVLEHEKFSMHDPADAWEQWPDDDDDKINIIKIREWLSEQEGCKPEEVDNRIVMYEFLQEKFKDAACAWRRVYLAADILIKNCCDPTLDYLEFAPGTIHMHVEAEQ